MIKKSQGDYHSPCRRAAFFTACNVWNAEEWNLMKMTCKQITELIEQEIAGGILTENQKIGTEKELMERFSVSRMTIRAVINNLILSGKVRRIEGRGAFVNGKILHCSTTFDSFSDLMRKRGLRPSSKLLALRKMVPPSMARMSLGLPEEAYCYFVKRIRLAENEPIAVETIYTRLDVVPELEKYDLENDSFYRVLEEEYQRFSSYNKETISAVYVSADIAMPLYEEKHGIALKVVSTLYDESNFPLEYSESWYHYEKFDYLSISIKK
jgi:GntR family transcriptional regulator